MSKALEIAEERFAKGEINKEELEEIKFALTDNKTDTTKSEKEKNNTGIGSIVFIVLGVIVVLWILQTGANIGMNAANY